MNQVWRTSKECISEEMSSKGQMTKETIYNGYKLASISVCLCGQIPKKTLCIDIDPFGWMKTKIIKSDAIMKKYQSKAQK